MRKKVLVRKDGYRLLWFPDHPAAHRGYVYEHRVVAEELVGRPLKRSEIVHHINEDRGDNRLENLEILTKAEHQYHHLGKSGITDAEVADLLIAGATFSDLIRRGVWQKRTNRIKKDLRARGLL